MASLVSDLKAVVLTSEYFDFNVGCVAFANSSACAAGELTQGGEFPELNQSGPVPSELTNDFEKQQVQKVAVLSTPRVWLCAGYCSQVCLPEVVCA